MNGLASWAHRYADADVPVFPLRPRSKTPAIAAAHKDGDPLHLVCKGECGKPGHGLYDATTDHAQINRWWRRQPDANIGIPAGPPSGWLIVDPDGPEGLAAWAALEQTYGQVVTVVVATGRGRHLIYAWPDGCELGNSKDRLGPHIDTRGIGGFVVAPPSVHPSGVTYRVVDQPGVHTLQEPPSWLLDALQPPAPAPPRRSAPGGACVVGGVPPGLPRHLQAQAAEAPNGDRSRQCYRLVCACVEWGLSDSEVHALLAAHQPTVEKYGDGDRFTTQITTIIDRARPDHRHVGKPCDAVDCPRAPRWMTQRGVRS